MQKLQIDTESQIELLISGQQIKKKKYGYGTQSQIAINSSTNKRQSSL